MPNWDILKTVGNKQKQASGLDEGKVLKLIASGQITAADHARPSGGSGWRPIAELAPFAGAFGRAAAGAGPSMPPEEEEDADQAPFMARKRPEAEELDLTAMVDVTFLLVLFFMLTATYTLQSSIEVPAPKPKEKGAQQQIQTLEDLEINNIIVRIDANNKITVDNQEVEAKRLVHHIREILYNTKKNELVIQAAKQCHHDTVVRVMDAANEVGMQKIRIADVAESSP